MTVIETQSAETDQPKRRRSYDCKGRVLTLLDNGMTVVPYEQTRGGWYAVVIDPGPMPECQKSYPRGGYNILVFDRDVETADEHASPTEQPIPRVVLERMRERTDDPAALTEIERRLAKEGEA